MVTTTTTTSHHDSLIRNVLQEIHDQGDLPEKSTDWLYRYFCSSLGYNITAHDDGTYSYKPKKSLQEDSLEVEPCSFAEFEKFYPKLFRKQKRSSMDSSSSTMATLTLRQSKRIKKTPAQAEQERAEIVRNRAATELLLTGLKKKRIIRFVQGEKLYYPKPITYFRRCILRSIYGLVAEEDRPRTDVQKFFGQHSENLTLFRDLTQVQQVMDECPVPLEGELICVGCHWMALKEGMLIDDGAYFKLTVNHKYAKKAIAKIFEEIQCDWDFIQQKTN